jgi:competence protein ComEC
MVMGKVTFARVPKLEFRASKGKGGVTNAVLGGSWVNVLDDPGDGFLKVRAFQKEGWVKKEDTGTDNSIRLYFVDVGQGDGCLVETPTHRLIVDGGKGANLYAFLTKYKYQWLVAAGERIKIDAIFVSHFDADHYGGLTRLIEDDDFEIGTLFHNGIVRLGKERPDQLDTELGETVKQGNKRVGLKTSFTTLESLNPLRTAGHLSEAFAKFIEACRAAKRDGRLGKVQRLSSDDGRLDGFGALKVDVLGPVVDTGGTYRYKWFVDPSHTVNGHSVVLKLTWGSRTFLLGGDLNDLSEDHLLANHPPGTFAVDVLKACHHGSSEFSSAFLDAAGALISVVSSGDDESYGHPQPDLMGALGRHSRAGFDRPLLFSTELARSTIGDDVRFGMIDVRSDGTWLIGAQFYDRDRGGVDPWNSFEVP